MGEGRERGASLLWLRIPEGWGGAVQTPDKQIPLNPSRPRWTRDTDEHARVEGGPGKGPVGHLGSWSLKGSFQNATLLSVKEALWGTLLKVRSQRLH